MKKFVLAIIAILSIVFLSAQENQVRDLTKFNPLYGNVFYVIDAGGDSLWIDVTDPNHTTIESSTDTVEIVGAYIPGYATTEEAGNTTFNDSTITSDIVLTQDMNTIQRINNNSATLYRKVYLSQTCTDGKMFMITNTDTYTRFTYLEIWDSLQSVAFPIDVLSPFKNNTYHFDGTKWSGMTYSTTPAGLQQYSPKVTYINRPLAIGSGAAAYGDYSIAIGGAAYAPKNSVSIGLSDATPGERSVNIGYETIGKGYSVSIGLQNSAYYGGISIGAKANELGSVGTSYGNHSKVLGYHSNAIWYGSLAMTAVNYDLASKNTLKNITGQLSYSYTTVDTDTNEIYLMAYADATFGRMKMRINSACKYTMDAIAISDSSSSIVKSWHEEGIIARDSLGTTMTLIKSPQTTIETGAVGSYDTSTWSIISTVDDAAVAYIPKFVADHADIELQVTLKYDYVVKKNTPTANLFTP